MPLCTRALGDSDRYNGFWWNIVSSVIGGLIVAGLFLVFDKRPPKGV